jgi:ABC-type transport system substrate-binding protein
MNRRTLIRGSAGATAAAMLGARGFSALAQGTPPADAAGAQEFRVAATAASVVLDPHLSYGISTIGTFTYFMWAGLTKVDENLKTVGDIATSWETDADGKVYTFHLDPNRKFADGTPITAHDVVWSWTRSLDPKTESLVAGGYLKDVVGATDYWQGKTKEPPTSYKAVDDHTFQVELIGPRNYFPDVLIHPSTFVVKQADVEAGSAANPWPTIAKGFSGPYAIKTYTQGNKLELVANSNYPIPQTIQQISYRLVDDPQTQFLLYKNNEVDFTPLAVADAANIINSDPTYRDQLIKTPQWWENNLYLRNQIKPFDDEHVRRAFMMAIDKDLLIKAVLKDLNPRIDGIYYPGMEVYTDQLKTIPYDPEGAKKELTQSSYGSAGALPAISAYIPGDNQTGDESRLIAAMQEMWKKNLGVEIEARVVPTYNDMLKSDVQIVIGGEALHYPDPSGIGYYRCGGGANISQFCDEDVDAQYTEATATTDHAKSIELYRGIQDTLLSRAALYPMYQVVSFLLVKPYIKNFKTTAMYTFPNFNTVYVAKH